MSKKAILTTFISATVLVLVVGAFSLFVANDQPRADVASSLIPPPPSYAPKEKPPLPSIPRLAGDAADDGIVDSLDANALIARFGQTDVDFNLVDDSNGGGGIISTVDLQQVFKYWKCFEGRTDKDCPYST